MGRLTIVLLGSALLTFAACEDDGPTDPPEARPDSVVTMFTNTFAPFTMEIFVGGTVLWDFGADSHNVIFDDVTGAPADIQATTNRVVGRKFNVAGTFPYSCTIHPGMDAEVVVTRR